MAVTKESTVREWVEELAEKTESGEMDWKRMECVLHTIGFPRARVICGIAYLEGEGTLEAPPMSVHSVARMLLDVAIKQSTT